MPRLRGKLREELKSEALEVVVYGEWIHKGTATSTKDEYNYAQRKILPGPFHAFGLGICLPKARCGH